MPGPAIAAWLLAAAVGAVCVWAALTGRRGIALGVLFTAASFSGWTAPLSTVGVRLEQPAIVGLTVLIAIRERGLIRSLVRGASGPIALLAIYFLANVASAVLFAPDVLQSLKISVWLLLSLCGAGVSAVLILGGSTDRPDLGLPRWVVAAGCVNAVVAAVQVVAEVVVESDWGILRSDAPIGKAFGLTWEPNLLSIQLAAALVFLLEPKSAACFSARVRMSGAIILASGMALALSRGGIIALVAATGVIGLSQLVTRTRGAKIGLSGDAVRLAIVTFAIAVGGYAGLSWLGQQGVGLRSGDIVLVQEGPRPTLTPVLAETPVDTAGPEPTEQPATVASPKPHYVGVGDTVALRFQNLQIAIRDGLTSPWIGLGPDTFGQRYIEPTCACPAHIPNQVAATFYEAGFVGLGALMLALGIVAIGVWRVEQRAYTAAIVALVVGYQITDAMRFAANWVLIGGALGLIVMGARSATRSVHDS